MEIDNAGFPLLFSVFYVEIAELYFLFIVGEQRRVLSVDIKFLFVGFCNNGELFGAFVFKELPNLDKRYLSLGGRIMRLVIWSMKFMECAINKLIGSIINLMMC